MKDNTIMGIAYASEMIEIVSKCEVLQHAQLTRHMKIIRDIIANYDLPTFNDMIEWHTFLMGNVDFAGKLRTFPAGRYTSSGYEPYPTYSRETLARKFEVFNRINQHTIISIADFHLQLTESHPFLDGNGRVCRLILNAQLHINGYGMCLIGRDNKNEYLTCLENRDYNQLAQFIQANLVM